MYKCINGWTKESMIEHVKKEFKGKSERAYRGCLYRNGAGFKCAVGMFIPDSEYHENMEVSGPVVRLLHDFPRLNINMPLDVAGCAKLQSIHDISGSENTLSDILNWIENNVEGASNV